MHATPDNMAESMERQCELPSGRPSATPALLEDVRMVQRELGHLAAELRYCQETGESADLDEWIFSLIFLETRMHKLAQHFVRPDNAFPEWRRSALSCLS
ncbi:MAG: hypothetical protein M0003_11275 [Acidithiobacillus sp.]|jgi:hypothetical protein|nr:hypothetical protein [Acidithiobacillus sp.]